ncbi:isopropylmalate isomerase [Epibacterium sp. SM1969]|uniref:Isopropylmalate isomerase n=2 Tax=Tritonibacter aquimaris TaxID=2663379 RepID=A0A844AMP4_9RHOB|nr:isopropylmalate isomerase [Tritonibacter aquimaris]
MYLSDMTLEIAQHFDLEDRARLRERFFGAARTVLARL